MFCHEVHYDGQSIIVFTLRACMAGVIMTLPLPCALCIAPTVLADIAELDGGSVAEITFPNPNNLTSFKVQVRRTRIRYWVIKVRRGWHKLL